MKRIINGLLVLSLLIGLAACGGDGNSYALIETDYGNMKVLLYDETPKHKENFIKLAKDGFFDDLLFHRVINGFMIQGGDPDSRNAPPNKMLGGGGPGYLVDAEIAFPHFKGTLAAARTGGASNPEKKSSGSQFYIVQGTPQQETMLSQMENFKGIKYTPAQREKYKTLGGRPDLDQEYTVFGEVVEGMDVIDKIAAVPTGQADRPVQDVKMKVSIVN
jgi:cyclophilin family peptidyl-prolyl cis-trans isomerase